VPSTGCRVPSSNLSSFGFRDSGFKAHFEFQPKVVSQEPLCDPLCASVVEEFSYSMFVLLPLPPPGIYPLCDHQFTFVANGARRKRFLS
jgi:hypothetical protein